MQRNDNPPGREKAVDTEWFHSYKNAPARLPADSSGVAGNGAKPSGRADCISCKDTNKPGAKTNLFAFYRRGVSKTKLKIITRRAENQIQLLFSAPPRNEARRGAFSFRSSVLAGASPPRRGCSLPVRPSVGFSRVARPISGSRKVRKIPLRIQARNIIRYIYYVFIEKR